MTVADGHVALPQPSLLTAPP
ncbi:hypothetical protein CCACVL1_30151 [Corchorus capsularis]|uniref:Uncharacterized protein n=1 Tax=Corchorus capsularis TaxID=210143 RepID=A0A1R3FYK1_COCAP|nr:hypothetical protein CCACVL1_30151 [Corchorus capsularis]